ncbi:unnamed protein product, partial [Effrenium voratum]
VRGDPGRLRLSWAPREGQGLRGRVAIGIDEQGPAEAFAPRPLAHHQGLPEE